MQKNAIRVFIKLSLSKIVAAKKIGIKNKQIFNPIIKSDKLNVITSFNFLFKTICIKITVTIFNISIFMI